MEELIAKFIKPDLFVLIPVLFLIEKNLKKSKIKRSNIYFIIEGIGIVFSFIWIFSTTLVLGVKDLLMAIFASFCQGILIAGATMFLKNLDNEHKKK